MTDRASHRISNSDLLDRIKGGWTGKSYGCMMGEPLEYTVQGDIYEGSLDIHPDAPLIWLQHEDDLYVNMAFLEIMREKGLDASIDDFANVFRESKFMLWHANGQARQNVCAGIAPALCGHPFYNPHADDIDFQIESDFIGLICPGLPVSVQDISNRVGRLMNYGEGYYAGVFLAALYAAAFIEKDPPTLIRMAQKSIPDTSDYSKMIDDLLAWYEESPDDWRAAWQRFEDKWNFDLCPWAKTDVGRFNIQGHFNGAYILMGLLFGKGDYIESVSICTRCGQDTDSNAGNCGGILGTVHGYSGLPQCVKDELEPYLDRDFIFTTLSINSATTLCHELALENIQRHGGTVDGEYATIATQPFCFEGECERSFIDMSLVDTFTVNDPQLRRHGIWGNDPARGYHAGAEELVSSSSAGDYIEADFNGTCVYMQGNLHSGYGIVDVYIDGELAQSHDLYIDPQWDNCIQSTAVWVTGLEDSRHTLRVVVSGRKNAKSKGIEVALGRLVSYRGRIAPLPTE